MNTSTAAPRYVRPLLPRTPRRAAVVRGRGAASGAFDEASIDAESVVSGMALVGMLCFVSLLFAGCFEAGIVA